VDETEGSLTNRIDTRQQAGPVRRAPLLIGAVNSDNVARPIEECVNIRTRNAGQVTILDLEGALKLGDAYRGQPCRRHGDGQLRNRRARSHVHDAEEGGREVHVFCADQTRPDAAEDGPPR
jgi:hypothetical protein